MFLLRHRAIEPPSRVTATSHAMPSLRHFRMLCIGTEDDIEHYLKLTRRTPKLQNKTQMFQWWWIKAIEDMPRHSYRHYCQVEGWYYYKIKWCLLGRIYGNYSFQSKTSWKNAMLQIYIDYWSASHHSQIRIDVQYVAFTFSRIIDAFEDEN